MDSDSHSSRNPRSDLLPQILALGIAATTWFWVPKLGFTGIDMGPLLLANRIEGLGGLIAPFAREVRDGIEPGVAFYRPWTGLSYGIDLALFGLRPAYFHLIDIAIHLASTVALLLLMRRLGAGVLAASLAALWFGAHPLAVEVVPATARRADLWAVLWLLVACLAALGLERDRDKPDGALETGGTNGGIRAGRSRFTSRAVFLIVVAGLLAPFSKEIGFALPFLLVALAPPARRFRWLVVGMLFVTPAALGRVLVLGGVGGYGGWSPTMDELPRACIDMLDPARLGGRWGGRFLALALGLWSLYLAAGRLPRAKLARFGLLWCALLLGAASLGRGLSAWYLYAPLPGVACLLASLYGRASSTEPTPPRWLRAGLAVLLLVVAAFSSPLKTSYPEWQEVSRQTRLWLSAVQRLPDEPFEGEHLIAGIPFQVGYAGGPTVRTRSAGCLMDFSLRAWSVLLNGRELDIHSVAYVDIVAPYSYYVVEVSPLWEGKARIQSFGNVRLRPPIEAGYFEIEESRWDRIVLRNVTRPIWRWNGRGLQRVPGGVENPIEEQIASPVEN